MKHDLRLVTITLALGAGLVSAAPLRAGGQPATARRPATTRCSRCPFTAVHFTDAFWLPRIEINRDGDDPLRVREVRGVEARLPLRAGGRRPARRDAHGQGAPRLSLRRHRPLQGDRGRGLHAERQTRSQARGLPRRPHREDRRRPGEGRLPLHDPHDRPPEPAPLGGEGALEPGEGGQPRALQPGPPLRGGGGALPGHRQADAARRGAPDRRAAGPDVRAGKAVDLARAPDHRDGPRQALPGHRRRALPLAREVPARRARPRRQRKGRAASTTSRTRRWSSRARRSATPCARPTCTRAWPTWRRSPASRPTSDAMDRIWQNVVGQQALPHRRHRLDQLRRGVRDWTTTCRT